MTPLAPLITRFLRDYMPQQRGYSPNSCEAYAISFKLLFQFAAERIRTRPSHLSVEHLDAPLIIDFLAHIERERRNCAATRNLRLAAIKAFMHYVEQQIPSALEQIGQIEAIPVKRHDQKLIRHLTMEEVRAIMNAPDLEKCSGTRDRAMMHLCFAGGLRVSELVGVLAANVSLGRTPSVMVQGKGRKERCLPIWKETARDLRAWLTVRGSVRVPELFVNGEGAPMQGDRVKEVRDKRLKC
jgi:integrase/recombinase XerD